MEITFCRRQEIAYKSSFPGDSDGKESACNVGDLCSIPKLGRLPEGGHGNPLEYNAWRIPHEQRNLANYSLGIAKSWT